MTNKNNFLEKIIEYMRTAGRYTIRTGVGIAVLSGVGGCDKIMPKPYVERPAAELNIPNPPKFSDYSKTETQKKKDDSESEKGPLDVVESNNQKEVAVNGYSKTNFQNPNVQDNQGQDAEQLPQPIKGKGVRRIAEAHKKTDNQGQDAEQLPQPQPKLGPLDVVESNNQKEVAVNEVYTPYERLFLLKDKKRAPQRFDFIFSEQGYSPEKNPFLRGFARVVAGENYDEAETGARAQVNLADKLTLDFLASALDSRYKKDNEKSTRIKSAKARMGLGCYLDLGTDISDLADTLYLVIGGEARKVKFNRNGPEENDIGGAYAGLGIDGPGYRIELAGGASDMSWDYQDLKEKDGTEGWASGKLLVKPTDELAIMLEGEFRQQDYKDVIKNQRFNSQLLIEYALTPVLKIGAGATSSRFSQRKEQAKSVYGGKAGFDYEIGTGVHVRVYAGGDSEKGYYGEFLIGVDDFIGLFTGKKQGGDKR